MIFVLALVRDRSREGCQPASRDAAKAAFAVAWCVVGEVGCLESRPAWSP